MSTAAKLYLRGFKQRADGPDTIEYKIGEIFGEIQNRFQSGYSLRDALELIDQLRFGSQAEKHELSHLYEAKIKNMGNAGRNGGEYYTPRPLIRAMIQVIKPRLGERIYDGAAGSAGFLCEAYDYLRRAPSLSTGDIRLLQERTFYGKEKKSLAYVIGIMNMILHGIEAPNIIHTNTLSENISDIQEKDRFNVILANPPFGGKERAEISKTSRSRPAKPRSCFCSISSKSLKAGGRAAIVIKNTFSVEQRQCQREPQARIADKLQSPHGSGYAKRNLPRRWREDCRAVLHQRRADAQRVVLQAGCGPQHGQDQRAQ